MEKSPAYYAASQEVKFSISKLVYTLPRFRAKHIMYFLRKKEGENKQMSKPKIVDIEQKDLNSLLTRVSSSNLEDSDKKLLLNVVQCYVWVQASLQEAKMSIARLRSLFGFGKTEKRKKSKDAEEKEDSESDSGDDDDQSSPPESETKSEESSSPTVKVKAKAKAKGHGRMGFDAYTGAEVIWWQHELLKSGDKCPELCGGSLYTVNPQNVIRITGHSLASAKRHELERLRCSLCGKTYTAHLPGGMRKYDEHIKAHLAIAKNYCGLPFYRMQMMQNMVGVPLPDATQWDLVESLADEIYPVYYALEELAAQGDLIYHDDTTVRILELIKENKRLTDPKDRTGMYTTGVITEFDQHPISIFQSGRKHSGENMQQLLAKRSPERQTPLRMCDALSSNISVEFITILLHCLSHARRKFYEIEDFFPGDCGYVLEALGKIYHHDAIAKEQNMNAEERLAYHQEHSDSIMTKLHSFMTAQLADKKVEENSSLGKAMNYMLKRWERFTGFLCIVGAPLDNNIVERALKVAIRSRKNSLFYKNEYSAFVGNMFTSLIHTCVLNNKNPVEYLVALQKNAKALRKNPRAWLPWNYEETIPDNSPPQLQAA